MGPRDRSWWSWDLLWFAANEGLTLWLVVGGLSSGLSGILAIATTHELGHKKRGPDGGSSPLFSVSSARTSPTSTTSSTTSGEHQAPAPARPTIGCGRLAEHHPGQFKSPARSTARGKTGLRNPTTAA